MKKFNELHAQWMRDDPEYRAAYEALADEFPETLERPTVYANSHKTDHQHEEPRATVRP